MKKSIYLSGIAGLCIMFIGVIFKIHHLAGAGIILILGIGSLAFLFMPIAYSQLLKSTSDKSLKLVYHMAFISFFFGFIGMMFKVQHWEGASLFILIAIPAPFVLFLPAYIRYHNKRKLNADLNFFAILLFMIYLGVFSALLSLRISKNLVDANANLGENIKEINNYLLAQNRAIYDKDLDVEALQLVNLIEKIKKEMACFAEPENKSVTDAASELDLWSINGKDASISGFFNDNERYSEFISNYELYKDQVNELKPGKIDFINKLFFEMDQNFASREGEVEVNMSNSILITALFTLTDCQNKLLLINHELNQSKL